MFTTIVSSSRAAIISSLGISFSGIASSIARWVITGEKSPIMTAAALSRSDAIIRFLYLVT